MVVLCKSSCFVQAIQHGHFSTNSSRRVVLTMRQVGLFQPRWPDQSRLKTEPCLFRLAFSFTVLQTGSSKIAPNNHLADAGKLAKVGFNMANMFPCREPCPTPFRILYGEPTTWHPWSFFQELPAYSGPTGRLQQTGPIACTKGRSCVRHPKGALVLEST